MKWQIGDVTVTKIVELETTGGSRFILPQANREAIQEIPWLCPDFADENGRLRMSIHALLIEASGRHILVDTCLGNDKKDRKVPTWNDRQGRFLEDLTDAGFPRRSINTVLCTHLHVDHVGWNTMLENGIWEPTFPNARYLFGRVEYEHWIGESERPDMEVVLSDSVQPIFDGGLAELVEWDH
jgi:glyoxylase-like metal-dependent hydrolase (beta-lactamase superfamily II)